MTCDDYRKQIAKTSDVNVDFRFKSGKPKEFGNRSGRKRINEGRNNTVYIPQKRTHKISDRKAVTK